MVEPYVNNGVPNRDFVDYDHPEGLYSVSVHRVTKQTEGGVMTPGGSTVEAREGQYLVARGGDKYDVVQPEEFDDWGLEAAWDQKDLPQEEAYTEEETVWDPNEHTAQEVRLYLRNPDISDEEKERVIQAEREGQNRRSAFPA